jgi:hypothetical protein
MKRIGYLGRSTSCSEGRPPCGNWNYDSGHRADLKDGRLLFADIAAGQDGCWLVSRIESPDLMRQAVLVRESRVSGRGVGEKSKPARRDET